MQVTFHIKLPAIFVFCLMIRLVLILTIFSSVFPAFAQTITISEELPLRNDYAYTIVGWVGDDLLLFRDKGHEFFVQAFDEEMHLKWEREIIIGQRRADILGVTGHDKSFHLLIGIRDKGDYFIQHRSYDASVTMLDTMTIDTIENIFITPRVFTAESQDESKILFFREINNGLDVV